ncbi:Cytochrome P450 76A2 [Camellia lanceoleosa]|uniref:Cytochrome P450 76A2 n=1 Tax=Camellia lanceoleosa TaxID=1840588 RepID=A0ACC0HR07_9ERIC|nr:Cytochrome P450 76A2 [Camellia lanceoleosa]
MGLELPLLALNYFIINLLPLPPPPPPKLCLQPPSTGPTRVASVRPHVRSGQNAPPHPNRAKGPIWACHLAPDRHGQHHGSPHHQSRHRALQEPRPLLCRALHLRPHAGPRLPRVLALAPYGTYWRVLRRICTVEMLVVKRINETVPVRRKCVDNMLTWIEEQSSSLDGARGVHVARFVFLASFNMLGNLMLSRDLVDPESKEGSEFFEAMMGLMEWTGHPNIGDLFPLLGYLDLKGLKRKMERDMGKALKIASGYVKERMKDRIAGDRKLRQDFLDVLLDFEGNGKNEPDKISDENVTIFILEIFLAGSETTSSTIEWAMTELLCNPKKMIKAKAELTDIVGPNGKMEESDIDGLPYLQAVVKETLRLHPPIPFLVPRKAIQDTNFMGYHIPKNTKVLINTWAIGRDLECWDDPMEFKPERFLDSKTDYKGQHYELIPFGAGRRMCAGVPLAHRMLHLVLGSLLHEFEWKLNGQVTAETMDRKERMGVTVRKFEPLMAVAKKN